MRTNPHILEVNTRSWLNRLEAKHGRAFNLADVPEEFLDDAKAMGFDAVWLMGVWKQSPAAREIARGMDEIKDAIRNIEPDFNVNDITASPYAVYEYEVDEALGGNEALAKLRERLHAKGIILLLDFVGNHTAIDCPAVTANPDLFINTGKTEPHAHKDWFFKNPDGVYIAHGRDPYFAPWTDSAQLNYFNPKTREFMLDNLCRVAGMCDGIRCDMAMLSLNKVHRDTWWEFIGGELPKEEFWHQALNAVREKYPEFVFIAEVYWGLEWEIQEMGFDYTYDKVLYDRLRFSTPENIKGHLGAEHLYQMRSIRFTSNHDEEESLKAFGREKSLAASTIIATLPGARLFHLFQILGRPARMPIQYAKDSFVEDEAVHAYYRKLLEIASEPAFHGGQWSLRDVSPLGDDSNRNILSWQWKQMNTGKIIFINYSGAPAKGRVSMKGVYGKNGTITEEFSGEKLTVTPEMLSQGYELNLKPYECKIFTFAV
ncbi:MAG: alpha-amylase family glycosyl hydrolase [Elusimicrobia bacterium]|nr:alpha-amylase family glycosyl hydrolase [Elusimicrobiota bacterium]MDY6039575.1 alpha-amylase family glycosyl hydrolase [Elusimicrobiaceae bacterium]